MRTFFSGGYSVKKLLAYTLYNTTVVGTLLVLYIQYNTRCWPPNNAMRWTICTQYCLHYIQEYIYNNIEVLFVYSLSAESEVPRELWPTSLGSLVIGYYYNNILLWNTQWKSLYSVEVRPHSPFVRTRRHETIFR